MLINTLWKEKLIIKTSNPKEDKEERKITEKGEWEKTKINLHIQYIYHNNSTLKYRLNNLIKIHTINIWTPKYWK